MQRALLSRLIHRDLSNAQHQTNVHKFYEIPYPKDGASFFTHPFKSPQFTPLDPSIHKPLTPESFLQSKLRWVTLGGQYDWTAKIYPSEAPPPFPADVRQLLEDIWPGMKPQAAIVNFYSPGDRLSVHRDVSEECDRPLVSISIGCEALFVCGLSEAIHGEESTAEGAPCKAVAVRLRSGDAVVMSGPSRFAWHGVPQVIKGTCPDDLESWPAPRDVEGAALDNRISTEGEEHSYEQWRHWMATKRININVRQMWA